MSRISGSRVVSLFWRSLGKGRTGLLPDKRCACPICGVTSVKFAYKHTEFSGVEVHICAKCGHGYTNRNYALKASGIWSTTKERADYHLMQVIPRWVRKVDGTFLEIGSCDF